MKSLKALLKERVEKTRAMLKPEKANQDAKKANQLRIRQDKKV